MKSYSKRMSFALLATALLSLQSINAEETQRKIKVAGTAVSKVVPDTIIWTLNVITQDKELPSACAKNEDIVASLIQFQKKELGADAVGEIQTGYLNIRKVYEKDRNRNNTEFKHFEVTRTVTLCQRDVKKFENVYRALSKRPDVQSSYRLESSDYTKIRRSTRLEAAKIAKTKAKEMTEVLDARLGKVLEISENTEARTFGYASNSFRNIEAAADNAPDAVSGSFAPGTIEVKVSVSVTFEIE